LPVNSRTTFTAGGLCHLGERVDHPVVAFDSGSMTQTNPTDVWCCQRRGDDMPYIDSPYSRRNFVETTYSSNKMARTQSPSLDPKARSSTSQHFLQKSRVRIFTAMPNRLSGLRCLPVVMPYATETGKPSRPRHFSSEGRGRDDSGRVQPVRRWLCASLICHRRPRLMYSATFMVGMCLSPFFFTLQVTPGSSCKQHWITSE